MLENNTDTTEVVETNQTPENKVKVYTEEDINNSFNAGFKKGKNEMQKDESYSEFLNWKKGNAETVKINEELQKKYENEVAEKNKILNRMLVNNSNVKKEFEDYVIETVKKNVTDEVDFEKALNQFKNEKPQFFGDVVIKKVQTLPNLGGNVEKPITTNNIMNTILKNAIK